MSEESTTSEIIEKIAQTYEKEWESRNLDFVYEFLSRVWAGIPLPALSVCGRGTQEIRYSKYLGYFLDPTKPHGLKTKYLDQLLQFTKSDKIETHKCLTETEKWLGRAKDNKGEVDCVCDIVVTTETHVIFIEQKINSAESKNPNSETTQLLRYDYAINNNEEFEGKEHIKIFLTPTGKISKTSPAWAGVSYTDLVLIGLQTLRSGGLSNIARENLKRFLMDLLLGPFKKAESEIEFIVQYAEKAVLNNQFNDRLRFDQLVSDNRLLIDLLMEG